MSERHVWIVETKESKVGASWEPMVEDVYKARRDARDRCSNYNYEDKYYVHERAFYYRVRKYTPILKGKDIE